MLYIGSLAGSEIHEPAPKLKKNMKTKIIGVGGYGDFVLNSIYDDLINIRCDIDIISINTDSQSQALLPEGINTINISNTGHGAGGKPEIGYDYAKQSHATINQAITGADVAILIAGLGKGTGTGASLYLSEVLKGTGAYTIVVLRTPEASDLPYRSGISAEYRKLITDNADAYIEINNDTCIEQAIKQGIESIETAYALGNEAVFDSVRGITSIVNNCGIRNVDLEDVKATIQGKFAIKTGSHGSFSTDCDIFAIDTQEARTCLSVIELPVNNGQTLAQTMELRRTINSSINPDCNQITGILTNPNVETVSAIYVISGLEKTLSDKRREAGLKGLESRYSLANASKTQSEEDTTSQTLAN